jgi:hypothetical protein
LLHVWRAIDHMVLLTLSYYVDKFIVSTEECFIHELMDEDSDEGLPNNGMVIFEIPS